MEQLKLLCIYLISRCYDISTGLFDTNMKRLYMCDKPGHHGRPPCKSRTADSILFEKEDVFCTTFESFVLMFVTKAFSLDCPYNTYITINVIIRVISVAANMSTSAIKLFRKDWNLELFCSGISKLCSSSLLNAFFLFLYLVAKSHNVLGALIKFGLISNVSRDIGRICSWVVQFTGNLFS